VTLAAALLDLGLVVGADACGTDIRATTTPRSTGGSRLHKFFA
jgi:hypothetical protein